MNQNHLNATLLVATAMLMARAGLKRLITRVGQAGTNYAKYGVGNGQGKGATLYLPHLTRKNTRVSILSLLEATGAKTTSWLANGNAHTGTRQILHYGDSGACVLVLSRQTVEARYRAIYGDLYESVMAAGTGAALWAQADMRNAPELARLIFRTSDDQDEIVDLPADTFCLPIYQALTGEVQLLDASQLAGIEPLLAMGRFALDVVDAGSDRFLLGRSADLASAQRRAA